MATGWVSSKGTPPFWGVSRASTFGLDTPFWGSQFLTREIFNIVIGTYNTWYGATNVIPLYTGSSVDASASVGGRKIHAVVYSRESKLYRLKVILDGTADFTLGTIYMKFNGQTYKLSMRYGTWPGTGTTTDPARIVYQQEDADKLTYDPFLNFNGQTCPIRFWYV